MSIQMTKITGVRCTSCRTAGVRCPAGSSLTICKQCERGSLRCDRVQPNTIEVYTPSMASDSNLEPWLSAALIPPFAPWWSTASGSMPLLSVNPPFTSNWTQEAAQTTSQTSFAASGLRPPRSATSADLIASQTGIPPALNPSASQSESPFHRTQHPYGPHQAENEDDDDDDIFVSARTTSGSKRKTSMSESGRRKKRVVAEESEAQM